MREKILLNENWFFTGRDGKTVPCNIPHTWNAIDGQDGGNDYYRGECIYTKSFEKPEFDSEAQCIYLEFHGVNASARV